MRRILTLAFVALMLLVAGLLAVSCSPAKLASTKGTGAEPKPEGIAKKEEVLAPEVKECSDFVSRQDIFIAEQNGELSAADKKSLDANGNGFYCDEPSAKFKDTRTQVEGLPPYEVAFVVDGIVPNLRSGEITIDISSLNKPSEDLLIAITRHALDNPDYAIDYRAALINYRDAETYEYLALGVYVADQEAAETMNDYVRGGRGWKIDFVSGEVPEGGAIDVVTLY